MRPVLLLIPLLGLAALPARAEVEVKLQQLKDIGILPDEKLSRRPEDKLDPKRSNPFAERSKAKEAKAVESVETEEIKIRRIFDTLQISGITKSNGQYSALLGDLILEEGRQVKPVIPNQTQILRVTKVTDKMVEIAWVEGAGAEMSAPRRIVKRVELSPRVGVLLAAQPPGSTDPNAMTWLDENGKVIWPKQMAPALDGGMGASLSPSSTADLSPEEEAHLMAPQAPGGATPPHRVSPALRENPAAPEREDPGVARPQVDPASGIEDGVETDDSGTPGETSAPFTPSGS